jgi:type 1 fimbria pilin
VVPVKEVAATHALAKGKDTKDLILFLQKCERLTQVRFDDQANAAVRKNNATVIDKNEDVPTQNGNIEVYN